MSRTSRRAPGGMQTAGIAGVSGGLKNSLSLGQNPVALYLAILLSFSKIESRREPHRSCLKSVDNELLPQKPPSGLESPLVNSHTCFLPPSKNLNCNELNHLAQRPGEDTWSSRKGLQSVQSLRFVALPPIRFDHRVLLHTPTDFSTRSHSDRLYSSACNLNASQLLQNALFS